MKAVPVSTVRTDVSDRQGPVGIRARPSRACYLIFAAAIVASVFVHELGHCTMVWFHGYPAIPTPAKEYILKPLPAAVQNQMALGGIIGSVIALVAASLWLHLRPGAISSSLLAGAMTLPGFYTLRFILAGRGHDATEFQEAQAALGLSYAGHALDWLFAALLLGAGVFWLWRTRPPLTLRLVGRLIIGSVVALTVLVLLQSINNAVFDPIFEPRPTRTQHANIDGALPNSAPSTLVISVEPAR